MSAPRIVPLNYQLTAAQAMRDALSNPAAKPLAVIPTGGGKSVVIAAFSQSILSKDRSLKILAVARSRVIQKHNRAALAAVAPDVPSLEFNGEALAPGVTFATAQKLYKSPEIIRTADLLVIDEADQAFSEDARPPSFVAIDSEGFDTGRYFSQARVRSAFEAHLVGGEYEVGEASRRH